MTVSVTSRAETLAQGLPRLLLAAERLAFVAATGLHGRRRAGAGESFWQFRAFGDSDDVRKIDWRRSAAGERLYIRDREHEAQAGFQVHLHNSSGMEFHSAKDLATKRDRAVLLLLALSSLLLRAGERVALRGVTPPLSGAGALGSLARGLISGGAAAADTRARRIEFGDFLLPNPLFTAPPGGAVLQILDPAECDFPYTGRVMFADFGPAPDLEAPNAAAWRSAYLARLSAQRQAVIQAASRAGQTALFHRTDAAPALALSALYQALRKT